MGLFGSRSYWPLPIIIRSRRRNLRLQNCFPRFCDLQQQQVLAGVFFLLLLIMSRMLRVVAVSICATQLNITRLQFLVFVPYFPFLFLAAKLPIFSKWKRYFWLICERFAFFSPPKSTLSFRICNSKVLNTSICNARMNIAATVVRQPYSLGGMV